VCGVPMIQLPAPCPRLRAAQAATPPCIHFNEHIKQYQGVAGPPGPRPAARAALVAMQCMAFRNRQNVAQRTRTSENAEEIVSHGWFCSFEREGTLPVHPAVLPPPN
jgi:hypothetical protein